MDWKTLALASAVRVHASAEALNFSSTMRCISRCCATGGLGPALAIAAARLPMTKAEPCISAIESVARSTHASEELIAAPAQVRGLKVIGRSSSFRFRLNTTDSRMVGAKLGVATLLEGTVRRQDRRVRIVVKLVNAADGRQLWAQTCDRELDDFFTVQADIAQSVAAALKGALHPSRDSGPKHHVPRFETYDHFLLGLQLLVRNDATGFPQAVEAFRQAIALDPDYADAYAYLAMAESLVADNHPGAPDAAASRRRAMAAAQRAVALDPQLGTAYAARGYLRAEDEWDWNGALSDLRTAVQLDPNNARNQLRYGYVLSAMGRLREAELAFEKGIEHDPLFPPVWYWLARTQAAQGDYTGARRAMQRVLAINPDFTDATSYLGVLALLEGDANAAHAIFVTVDTPWNLAMAEHDLGQPVRAQRTLMPTSPPTPTTSRIRLRRRTPGSAIPIRPSPGSRRLSASTRLASAASTAIHCCAIRAATPALAPSFDKSACRQVASIRRPIPAAKWQSLGNGQKP